MLVPNLCSYILIVKTARLSYNINYGFILFYCFESTLCSHLRKCKHNCCSIKKYSGDYNKMTALERNAAQKHSRFGCCAKQCHVRADRFCQQRHYWVYWLPESESPKASTDSYHWVNAEFPLPAKPRVGWTVTTLWIWNFPRSPHLFLSLVSSCDSQPHDQWHWSSPVVVYFIDECE